MFKKSHAELLLTIQRSVAFARDAFPGDVDQRATSFISHLAGSIYPDDPASSDLVFELLFNQMALPKATQAPAGGAQA
ncbi:MAG: hypothetical protein M3Y65_20665 [Pseudomonadota bacterium]|nr:hypothetical protein [Pseudomonadota bacterium]